jgi:hypothetical protein
LIFSVAICKISGSLDHLLGNAGCRSGNLPEAYDKVRPGKMPGQKYLPKISATSQSHDTTEASAADLKFLHRCSWPVSGTSNRKAALVS